MSEKVKELVCKITNAYRLPTGSEVYDYAIYDGNEIVAQGSSSSPDWVRHDAGGYHTKANFDSRYPGGWNVSFDFQ